MRWNRLIVLETVKRSTSGIAVMLALSIGTAAQAQNAVFQSYFFDVCSGAGTPTGALATRCGETPGANGDLSGDSEDSLNPSQFVGTNEGSLLRARARERELQSRIEATRSEAADPDRRPRTPRSADLGPGRVSLLVNGRWTGFERDESNDERGLEGDVWSAQLGGDVRVSDAAVIGGLFTYDRLTSEFDRDSNGVNFVPASHEGSIEADSYTGSLFGAFTIPETGVYADLSAGFGYTEYEIERNVVFQETNRAIPQTRVRTRARPDGFEVQAGGTLGYDFVFDALSAGPYVRTVYVHTEIESFDERDQSGSGLAMDVDRQERDSLVSILGARASYAVGLPFGVLLPQLRVEWEHEFLRDAQTAHPSYSLDASGRRFRVEGEDPDRDYVNLGGSLLLVLPHGWQPFVDYQALLAYVDLERHTVTLGLRKEF